MKQNIKLVLLVTLLILFVVLFGYYYWTNPEDVPEAKLIKATTNAIN